MPNSRLRSLWGNRYGCWWSGSWSQTRFKSPATDSEEVARESLPEIMEL
ncbi:MAG: hypothetical protein LBT06_10650 [Hungatella sp.]|nr:hypothetical protein [Hungatella sp.]